MNEELKKIIQKIIDKGLKEYNYREYPDHYSQNVRWSIENNGYKIWFEITQHAEDIELYYTLTFFKDHDIVFHMILYPNVALYSNDEQENMALLIHSSGVLNSRNQTYDH